MPSKTQDADAAPEFRTLGESMNLATRPVHTRLNKLVILRLRLALPPHADDASNYVQGLLHIAPIYTTFETLWQEILSTPVLLSTSPSGVLIEPNPNTKVSARIHAILTATHFTALTRSAALNADLTHLTGWRASELATRLRELPRDSPVLADFLAHIRDAVGRKPHVLLAYAWVLYMALFAGGRFIRASLERVDPAGRFWGPLYEDQDGDLHTGGGVGEELDSQWRPRVRMPGAYPTSSSVSVSGRARGGVEEKEMVEMGERQTPLSFFRFDTPADGQDLRQAFKTRVAEATDVLTPEEVTDVVSEAVEIFERMVGLVGELDDVCGTEFEAAAAT